jgi:hypothetical protein
MTKSTGRRDANRRAAEVIDMLPKMVGRPAHAPNKSTVGAVRALYGTGYTQAQIAEVVGIDLKTLRAHYGEVMAAAKVAMDQKVIETLFQIATNPKHPRCVTAAIHWTKCQMGWNENREGSSDSLIRSDEPDIIDSSKLSPEARDKLRLVLREVAAEQAQREAPVEGEFEVVDE